MKNTEKILEQMLGFKENKEIKRNIKVNKN